MGGGGGCDCDLGFATRALSTQYPAAPHTCQDRGQDFATPWHKSGVLYTRCVEDPGAQRAFGVWSLLERKIWRVFAGTPWVAGSGVVDSLVPVANTRASSLVVATAPTENMVVASGSSESGGQMAPR